ncbi:hypothetical protein BDV96DRAFT_201464 [Lophiotrema nucula]|uniref:RING-type domain-containing protein n=1 Tax=Lophiotrema nucula TaxID=690887 RepID=A0A6A5YWA7_9PLEO|nr:hypothetical protein BDV96DRAFT_201464 [Lophiotrema nucula]
MLPTFTSAADFIEHGLNIPECPICREEYNSADGQTGDTYQLVSIDMCGHQFHKGCLVTWATEHNTCPTCRGTLYDRPTQESAETMIAVFGQSLLTLRNILLQYRQENIPLPNLTPDQLNCINVLDECMAESPDDEHQEQPLQPSASGVRNADRITSHNDQGSGDQPSSSPVPIPHTSPSVGNSVQTILSDFEQTLASTLPEPQLETMRNQHLIALSIIDGLASRATDHLLALSQ